MYFKNKNESMSYTQKTSSYHIFLLNISVIVNELWHLENALMGHISICIVFNKSNPKKICCAFFKFLIELKMM